jgi:hypothetical protein
VQRTQRLLKRLFLLIVDEQRVEVVPAISLGRIRDNPTITKNG